MDNIEPSTIFQGDTVEWLKSLADYPAPTWILEYFATTQEGQISFIASADGTDHKVSLDATTTAQFDVGEYRWVAKVRQGVTVKTIDSGTWEVLIDLASQQSGYDTRTHSRKCLDFIEKAIEDYFNGKGLTTSYSIGDSQFTFRTIEEVFQAKDRYTAFVAAEEADERVRRGLTGRRQIKVML